MSNYFEELEKAKQSIGQGVVDSIYIPNQDTIEKGGKRAQVGETRTWGGQTYRKEASGWVSVKSGSTKTVDKTEEDTKKEVKPFSKKEYIDALRQVKDDMREIGLMGTSLDSVMGKRFKDSDGNDVWIGASTIAEDEPGQPKYKTSTIITKDNDTKNRKSKTSYLTLNEIKDLVSSIKHK